MKALKLMAANFNASYSTLLLTYNKDSLFTVRIRKCMEMVYKIINNLCPKYLEELILMKNVDFDLRGVYKLCVLQFHSVMYGKSCFRYDASFYWNTLPNNVKESLCFKNFKKSLLEWRPACKCGFCIICNISNM